jgi:nicotinate-nucleotide adenylyltransferase
MAMDKYELSKVIFIPTSLPPHKKIANLASAHDRYNMVRLAIEDNPAFAVSDFEIKKGGKSYTIDTVRHFRETLPIGTKIFFIIGSDNLEELNHWKEIDQILEIVSFIVVNRPGFEDAKGTVRHHSLAMPGMDISSSYLRRGVVLGKSIKYLVPEKVFRYIEKYNLFLTK